MTALTIVFYVATYGVLSVLSWREFVAWCRRRGIEQRRRELRRLPRIDVDLPRINTIRRDPTTPPRKRASA